MSTEHEEPLPGAWAEHETSLPAHSHTARPTTAASEHGVAALLMVAALPAPCLHCQSTGIINTGTAYEGRCHRCDTRSDL